MAIVNNFWLKDQTKQLAGAVIYQAMGQTRSRRLAESVSNPRTPLQMNQRVKWANLVNFYRANSAWMKYAYETRKSNQSEYNKFMSLNVTDSRIFLSKQLAAAGACVAYPYLITQGSLAPIETISTSTGWQTNIILDGGTVIAANTTVAELSRNLLTNNPGIQEGDQLSFIRVTQLTNSDTGIPYIVVRRYEMLVKSTGAGLVADYLPLAYIDSNESESEARLIVKNSGNAGGFALILSRTIGGKTYVSSQRLIIANNEALISQYSSDIALQAAIDSYGQGEEAFLSSSTANQAAVAPVANSIVRVNVGTDDYLPGQVYDNLPDWAGGDIYIYFSQPVTGSSIQITARFWRPGVAGVRVDTQTAFINNGVVFINGLNTEFDDSDGAQLAAIVVSVDGTIFEATFGERQNGGLD